MKNLYIDFDGVILDTLPPVYNLAKKLNLDYKTQTKEMSMLFSKLDWETLIEESPDLNDSVNAIKKLSESGKFNISILTHVNSLKEAKAKIKFLDDITSDLTIIPVPKDVPKTMMTQTIGAVLVDDYSGNLKLWQEAGGIAVKFTKEKEECEYLNITSLEELLDMFD
ncbi:MAG: hypothetical protein J6J17_05375 [Bacilli bacterium]|nr:hypothetical protein [Bacilli bacterium]